MTRHNPSRAAAGFTLVELLIVLVIAVLLVTLGLPNLLGLLARQRLEGQARDVAALVHRARHEALVRGVPAVVELDADGFTAFVDVHGASLTDPPDGVYEPLPAAPVQGTDLRIGDRRLHERLHLEGPGAMPGVEGLTFVDGAPKAIFDPDGSVRDTGAIRISDRRGNVLELRIAPRATGRIGLYKWDGMFWRANGEGGTSWTWH
jgi:prepilin-type N-terminal cleavage/methylation domain-containing protein